MIACLDESYDLEIYLEGDEGPESGTEIIEGMLLRVLGHSKKIVPITFGVDDIFAREHGNYRVGARFERETLDVRLSRAAYRELCKDEIFAERYTLRDGSKITISEAVNPRNSLHYWLLQDDITLLEAF